MDIHQVLEMVSSSSMHHRVFIPLEIKTEFDEHVGNICQSCKPNHEEYDSCLGDDQRILSSMVNDKDINGNSSQQFWIHIKRSLFCSDNAKQSHNTLQKNDLIVGRRVKPSKAFSWSKNIDYGELVLENMTEKSLKRTNFILAMFLNAI